MKITAFELSLGEILNVAHGAVEGGTSYWGEIKDYKWSGPDGWYADSEKKGDLGHTPKDLADDFVLFRIAEADNRLSEEEATHGLGVWHPITVGDIRRGALIAVNKAPHLFEVHGDEFASRDAYGDDAIVQCAIYGEIIYG